MKTAEFITAAIPDSIRMGTHDDEKLLFSVLVSVLKTYHENASSWDKTIARHIHEALSREYTTTIAPHIADETRDWDAMRTKAEAPREAAAVRFKNQESWLTPSLQWVEMLPEVSRALTRRADDEREVIASARRRIASGRLNDAEWSRITDELADIRSETDDYVSKNWNEEEVAAAKAGQ